MQPLVSILIPAYNAAPWIAATIQSALDQACPNKEIIIVDDGSKDQTLAVARQFASKTVSVVSQTNQGAAAARNQAFSLCQGDYIQWLDADDLLAPDKIARQMEVLGQLQDQRVLASSAWGHFHFRPHRAKFSPNALWCDLDPLEWMLRKLGQGLQMTNMTWLVSREITQAAGPWDTRLSLDDDGEYFCRVVLASRAVHFVPEAKSFYRRSSPHSLSQAGGSNRKLDSLHLSNELHVKYLLSIENSDRTRTAALNYLQKYMYDFCPERPDIVREMQQLAAPLGGRLKFPKASWKYAGIQRVCGWGMAKQAQINFLIIKESLLRFWDKTLLRLEGTDRPRLER
jgi:glycosyltransferase involved in cell wall biosynthesis